MSPAEMLATLIAIAGSSEPVVIDHRADEEIAWEMSQEQAAELRRDYRRNPTDLDAEYLARRRSA